jgi:conjugative relaxase-like TrwC/TraI family protein
MVQSSSAGQAKSYYADALVKSDYYVNEQELGGDFRGLLADRLGLKGAVTKERFFELCENRNPLTGHPLSPRTKDNRTVGYDINFHVPKSVSIVHALSKDDHILEAFRSSVYETMADIEADAKTRVRVGNADQDRQTGELLWTDFVHNTARPVKGQLPDPHLHAHCYVFNATWDDAEQKVKAAQFRDIVRDSPYYTARFQKRLSDRLMDLGYGIRSTKKAFEIEGVPQRAIEHFSKRTDEIGRAAKEQGVSGAEALDRLGAKTRAKKQKGLGMDALKADWRKQIQGLGISEIEGAKAVRFGATATAEKENNSPEKSVAFSLNHHFERASVVPERRLQATAYKQSIGQRNLGLDDLDAQMQNDASLIWCEGKGQRLCTTKAVLSEEQHMVKLAQAGRGTMNPLYKQTPDIQLEGQQGRAIAHILTTSDRVSIIRGAAGTGKTTLMSEAADWMQKVGKEVSVVAPSSDAARGVLRGDGFEQADTVAALLVNTKAQEKLQDGVLWVDEAGLLGTRDMTALLELTHEKNARLILGGDTLQHSSVDRGDALRILNTVGKIKTAEVSKIHRQKKADYREAVQALSSGDVKKGFERLDTMGAIKTVDPKNPNAALVEDYMGLLKEGKDVLVIAPTNAHRKELTGEIRGRMRQEGLLGKKEIKVDRLQQQHFSLAEKENKESYTVGQVIQFNQNAKGFQRGSRWEVQEVSEKGVFIANQATGKTSKLPQDQAARFNVMERSELKLAKGDKVRVTHSSYDQDKKRMDTGQTLEVLSVRKDGAIELQNKISKQTYNVDHRFGHMDHAHCVTSYAAQGKTVDHVLVAQPEATFPATNAKQFYVSASRAREGISIYTDDKEKLLDHAQRTGNRSSALEMTAMQKHSGHAENKQREVSPRVEKSSPVPNSPTKNAPAAPSSATARIPE